MKNVRAALVTTFIATDIGISADSICYENRPRPDVGGPWAAFHFMPGKPKAYTLGPGGQDICRGIVQIDVNDNLGVGEELAANAYAALKDAFTIGTDLIFDGQVVKVVSCSRIGGRVVDGWYRVAITISWEAFLTRKIL